MTRTPARTNQGRAARRLVAAALGLLICAGLPPATMAVDGLPAGFTATDYVAVGQRLTAMAWSPDGRLFISEKAGPLRVVKNGALLAQPFSTLSVDSASERGLLGIAFDPAFTTNRHVYIYYTYSATQKNRVSRLTASATNPDVAQAGSELVILDNIPSDAGNHNGGAIHFGPDGKLYVAVGDSGFGPNSQDLAILAGKMLRINSDGTVPADNPFVGQAGKRAEIWASGLRNPYTFAFQAGTGRMFINDVGNNVWEEINEGTRGANYGWPTCEGPCSNPSFVDPVYAYRHDAGPGKAVTGAVFYSGNQFPAGYADDFFFADYVGHYIKRYDVETGQVFDFANDVRYPADLRVGPDGALYYLSVEAKKIGRIAYGDPPAPNQLVLTATADNHTASNYPDRNFGRSSLVYVNTTNPVDNIFLRFDLSGLAGRQVLSAVLRIHTANQAAAGSAGTQNFRLVEDTSWGELTLTHLNKPRMSTQLGSLAGTVPNSDYSVALAAAPIQARAGGLLSIGVEGAGVRDNMYFHARENATSRPQLIIEHGPLVNPPIGDPPEPSIDQPPAGTTYRAGDVITFSGSATDPEDGDLAPDRLAWQVDFHHDTHSHPFIEPFTGSTEGEFTIPDVGEPADNVWYRILLTATDSDGNTSVASRDILPLKSTVRLETDPPGLTLLLDGSPVGTPHSFVGVEGIRRQLTAPATQTLSGTTYEFVSWSDGAARDHSYPTPVADTTKTATYRPASGPPPIVQDTFGRSVTGGWGSAEVGGAYATSGNAANFSVAAGVGRMILPAAGANRGAFLSGVSTTDADVRFRVSTDKPAVGGVIYAYGEVRRVGTSSYRPKVILRTNGEVAVHAGVVVNGAESSLGPQVTVAGLTHAAGSFIWLRAQVTGANPTTIRVKAWADGQPEPVAWQFSATNFVAALQSAGGVGLRAYMSATNSPVTVSFDDYTVSGSSQPVDPPPPPAGTAVASDAFARTVSSGWGSATLGGAYTLVGSAASFGVGSGVGSITLPTAGSSRAARLDGVSVTNIDVTVQLRLDKVPSGGPAYVYLELRRAGTNAYRPKVILHPNGTVSVHAGVLINGAETSMAPAVVVPGLTYTANSFIWLRAQVTGANPSTIRVKAWAAGSAEPSAWQFSSTSGQAAVQGAGVFAIRAYAGSRLANVPIIFAFDDLSVIELSQP